jgi:hypothetical protein
MEYSHSCMELQFYIAYIIVLDEILLHFFIYVKLIALLTHCSHK